MGLGLGLGLGLVKGWGWDPSPSNLSPNPQQTSAEAALHTETRPSRRAEGPCWRAALRCCRFFSPLLFLRALLKIRGNFYHWYHRIQLFFPNTWPLPSCVQNLQGNLESNPGQVILQRSYFIGAARRTRKGTHNT